jgi:O-acetyl-ADP-ribose deacetylase (regulator of RNase III)
MPITYLTGDATEPIAGEGIKIITHICNNAGGWGAGFVLALSAKWSKPEVAYKKWYKERNKRSKYTSSRIFTLGNIQLVKVEDDILVANMIAQEHYKWINNIPPIRYEALANCLDKLNNEIPHRSTVHMPRIGCGLAGGKWKIVEAIINTNINKPVFVYDLPESQANG